MTQLFRQHQSQLEKCLEAAHRELALHSAGLQGHLDEAQSCLELMEQQLQLLGVAATIQLKHQLLKSKQNLQNLQNAKETGQQHNAKGSPEDKLTQMVRTGIESECLGWSAVQALREQKVRLREANNVLLDVSKLSKEGGSSLSQLESRSTVTKCLLLLIVFLLFTSICLLLFLRLS